MKLINNPDRSQWAEILKRPVMNTENLFDTVREIIDRVKSDGDRAVLEMEAKFDKAELTSLAVTEAELKEAETLVDEKLKAAIRLAKQNIETFHAAQRFEGKKVETMPGVTCWQKAVAIEKVGLYIPGGTAPLFSTVLMLAVPAKIAGCKEIVLCTPPDKEGRVHPAILFAAQVAGVNRIFKAGGVQAIASMAYGTESVPKVYKIFGPGNQYVTAAKQLVSLRDVAIDMPAGPSEVEVLADETANPVFVAADLLSQAEHGVDSQAMLITTSEALQQAVKEEVGRQLELLPRKEIAEKSLANSKLIVVKDMEEAIELTNEYAPEHLIVETADYMQVSRELSELGWSGNHEYMCLILQITYLNQQNLSTKAICRYIKKKFEDSVSFLYQDEIVAFFDLTRLGKSQEEVAGKLVYFIRDTYLKAGYSRVMTGHMNLRRQYVQAKTALDVGSRKKPYLWIHYFGQVALTYILEQATRRLPGTMICHEGLLELKKHDEENQTQYMETLRVYLEQHLSATQAARELFIHRSTFLYRLDRIKEILQSELDDPEEIFYLELSFRLLEQEREKE